MIRNAQLTDAGPAAARFAPGDVVFHKRYHYRGVVVDFDTQCRASQAWYAKNHTQPSREQPWYHVLVHNAHHTTYAAQENLSADPSPAPVSHPLIEQFFHVFVDGRYLRNDKPWAY